MGYKITPAIGRGFSVGCAWTWLGCVDTAGDGSQLAAVHASSSSEASAEISSTNPMSSLCRSASASASASRCASAANAAERTSGTHTWARRYPRRRMRSRYSRALCVDAFMLPLLRDTLVACNRQHSAGPSSIDSAATRRKCEKLAWSAQSEFVARARIHGFSPPTTTPAAASSGLTIDVKSDSAPSAARVASHSCATASAS